jgi:conjugal transfer pilus assembly protein TraU
MSKNAPSVSYFQANAELAAKFIAKMHREMILWITSGPMMTHGFCTPFPSPVWKKRQYNLLTLYPVPGKNRQPIGRSALLWGAGKNPPFLGSDFVWMMYRKRDCCAF